MKKFASDLIDTARDALADRIIRTPVLPLESSKIAPYIPDDTQLFMKLELFQHTGSFKARGALLGVDWLSDAQKAKGVATFSGGNHALATAWAARKQGISAKVLMTEAADPIRIDGCRALGTGSGWWGGGKGVVRIAARGAAMACDNNGQEKEKRF